MKQEHILERGASVTDYIYAWLFSVLPVNTDIFQITLNFVQHPAPKC